MQASTLGGAVDDADRHDGGKAGAFDRKGGFDLLLESFVVNRGVVCVSVR